VLVYAPATQEMEVCQHQYLLAQCGCPRAMLPLPQTARIQGHLCLHSIEQQRLCACCAFAVKAGCGITTKIVYVVSANNIADTLQTCPRVGCLLPSSIGTISDEASIFLMISEVFSSMWMDPREWIECSSHPSVDHLAIVRRPATPPNPPSSWCVVLPPKRTACHDVMMVSLSPSLTSLASLDPLSHYVSGLSYIPLSGQEGTSRPP
jgi:hypothetical protein